MSIHVSEPHPSVSQTSYIHSGRGGAGNYHAPPSTLTPAQEATGPASVISLAKSKPQQAFASGRGGAGNMHHSKERAMFSFDEELDRIRLADAPVYHVGRGGYGNSVNDGRGSSVRQGSSSSMMSKDSDESGMQKKGSKVDWVKERLGLGSEKAT